jgi:hypothetical protein
MWTMQRGKVITCALFCTMFSGERHQDTRVFQRLHNTQDVLKILRGSHR